MKHKVFTAEQKQEWALAYSNGAILKDLAREAEVSIPTMAKYVRAGGATVRPAGSVRKGNGDFVKTVEAVNDLLGKQQAATFVVSPPYDEAFKLKLEPEVTTPQAPIARRILPFE